MNKIVVKVKNLGKKWKKTIFITTLVIVAFVGLVILLISPITKYLIEKYDVKYTGREIKMDWLYVNPFTGYIHFNDLKIYEKNRDTVFFSVSGLSANFAMAKLLNKTYEISSLTLDKPKGIVVQNKKHFNFSDLIDKFTSTDKPDTSKIPVHFNILEVEMKDGEFKYIEEVTPINYSIKKVNFKSKGKYWNIDSTDGSFSFMPSTGGGDVKGKFNINLGNLNYRLSLLVNKLDLNIIEQYMLDIANYGRFRANMDADLKAIGNLNDNRNINLKGKVALNDFHFGKTTFEDFGSFKKLSIGITELDPKRNRYSFDTIFLLQPYFKYEKYDYLDNLQYMFGNIDATIKGVQANPEKFNLIIEIGNYIKDIFRNVLNSQYRINHLAVANGDVKFNDYSTNEKFSAQLFPLNLKADSVYNSTRWVSVFLNSGIKPFGQLQVSASMNPKDNTDFNFAYNLNKIPAAAFNPYLITYTSFPLNRGVVALNGNWTVRKDIINSINHFVFVDPRVTKRIKKRHSPWIPLPLIMTFIRETGNVVDYEIPITGDLKNPKFHFKDAIFDLVKNILIKPPTTPYRIDVKHTENEIEKLLSLNWGMRQTELLNKQDVFMHRISKFLEANPEAVISVHPITYSEKEKEYILFFEAKKKYYFNKANRNANTMSRGDSVDIERMYIKDPSFTKYLDNYSGKVLVYTTQEKCMRMVGATAVNALYEKLIIERERIFMQYFKDTHTEKQVKLYANENTIPFNGFSFFRINYKTDIPESLLNAYEQLSLFNSESPRKKYLKFRKGRG